MLADKPGKLLPKAIETFRHEVIADRRSGGLGEPLAAYPGSWLIVSGILVTLIVGLACFASLASFSRRESVRGILRSTTGQARILPPFQGTIAEVYVHEGDIIPSGRRLLKITSERVGANGLVAEQEILDTLRLQEKDVNDRRKSLQYAGKAQDEAAKNEIESIAAQVTALESTKTGTEQRLRAATASLSELRPVAERGFISKESMRLRENEVSQLRQVVGETVGQIASLKSQMSAKAAALIERPMNTKQVDGQLRDAIVGISQQRAQLEISREVEVRSPISGTVSALQADVGDRIDGQSAVLTIVPSNAILEAEIYIPSRAIGFLLPNQRVRIMYDAFPFQHFGAANGTITSISESILRPTDIKAAIKVDEPVYRAVVRLPAQSLLAYGRPYRLHSGMSLTADVILERQTILQWLLNPILASRGRF